MPAGPGSRLTFSCSHPGSSGRKVTSIARLRNPGVGRDPVDLPCLALVRRESLLESDGRRRDVMDDKPYKDRLSVQHLVVIELAAPVLELTDGRRRQAAIVRTGEVQAPLPRFRVVEPKAQALKVPTRAVGFELDQV